MKGRFIGLFAPEHMADALLQAAQFGQARQSSDGGVTGIERLIEIAEHTVAVIGPHRQGSGIALHGPTIELFDHGPLDRRHTGAAAEMVRFIKTAVGSAPDIAQVQKIDAVADAAKDRGKIVGGMRAQRSRAEGA